MYYFRDVESLLYIFYNQEEDRYYFGDFCYSDKLLSIDDEDEIDDFVLELMKNKRFNEDCGNKNLEIVNVTVFTTIVRK